MQELTVHHHGWLRVRALTQHPQDWRVTVGRKLEVQSNGVMSLDHTERVQEDNLTCPLVFVCFWVILITICLAGNVCWSHSDLPCGMCVCVCVCVCV
jgi:hypothetical protein